MNAYDPLDGRHVLLVEDESLVAMLAEDLLEQAGCNVMLAMRLSEALEIASSAHLDCAVLDINLGGGDTSSAVADLLVARGIPFLFATGYDVEGIPPRFREYPRVQKPYAGRTLLELLGSLAQGSTRSA